MLQVLGEAAIRLSNGQPVDDHWLQGFLHAATPNHEQQQLLTVPEACGLLKISRWSFYRLIQQNELRTVTIGRRRFVPHAEISRFITTLTETGAYA